MPIGGHLSEFPLPEVLLLIGSRTGRLRLYNVPEFADMELDLSDGKAHALHLGGSYLIEDREIVTELSVIVGTGEGMFEFKPELVISVQREQPLAISQLVMMLVLHVDEILAKQRTLLSTEPVYFLQTPVPAIWIDPELNVFFHRCKSMLENGARSEEIAENLEMDHDEVRLSLTYLRQLDFVQMFDGSEISRDVRIKREITSKADEFQLAAEASALIRRTGALLNSRLG